jgi:hypothetical protein
MLSQRIETSFKHRQREIVQNKGKRSNFILAVSSGKAISFYTKVPNVTEQQCSLSGVESREHFQHWWLL